jgi:hypothetical protein
MEANDKTWVAILIMAIVLTLAIVTIVLLLKKKKKTSTTGSKSTQDYVNQAAPGEQTAAKSIIDSFKNDFHGKFSLSICDQLLEMSDNELAWAATYYQEQTGRNLLTDVENLSIWGWSSLSFSDNHLEDRLKLLGF